MFKQPYCINSPQFLLFFLRKLLLECASLRSLNLPPAPFANFQDSIQPCAHVATCGRIQGTLSEVATRVSSQRNRCGRSKEQLATPDLTHFLRLLNPVTMSSSWNQNHSKLPYKIVSSLLTFSESNKNM